MFVRSVPSKTGPIALANLVKDSSGHSGQIPLLFSGRIALDETKVSEGERVIWPPHHAIFRHPSKNEESIESRLP